MSGQPRTLRRFLFGIVIAASLLAGPSSGIAATDKNSFAGSSVDAVLRNAVEQKKIPGVVAMVADANGVLYQRAFGKRDEGHGIPMTADTIFRIASMTKPVTSVALMQLVELGKVKLDAPAGTYLPELSRVMVLDAAGAKSGEPVLRAPKSPVTVRQLLTHTSGFVYENWDRELHEYRTKSDPSGASGAGLPGEPLLFDPGTQWHYGTSTLWLGKLVEAVSGQTLEEYFRQHILDPLGMADTSFDVPLAKQARLVTIHQREPGGRLVETPPSPIEPVKNYRGDGGLYSTAPDYVTFMRMILAGGQLGTTAASSAPKPWPHAHQPDRRADRCGF